MPRPTAWPLAVRFTVSDEAICPVILAVTFTTPPHTAETLPDIAVDVRLEICHWRSEQLVMFGRPAMAPDAHVPDAAGVVTDGLEDDVEEFDELELDDELDELDEEPVDDELLLADGAVGSSRFVLF